MVIIADVPYMNELINVRRVLEKILTGYPTLYCQHAAKILNIVNPDLDEVAGHYIMSNGKSDWHAWNFRKKHDTRKKQFCCFF
ncbi:MAG: hypothetical protein KKF46_04465 [Nanoarchaeota archaeon]|nr:hypothetical protein [Nanoarchaeota archaeon]MBU1321590.1 hypothetical protein [Nanoarchaeota archaeon]MBU1598016.1 hypothetical protein [Nanoarchaeota archaeon]MBU2440966.1 hypothetical protein [Nanoarchaeota archaeon]